MSYCTDNVTVQIPGSLMQGKSAVREHFFRLFITVSPGNRHSVKNLIFGRDVAVIEFIFGSRPLISTACSKPSIPRSPRVGLWALISRSIIDASDGRLWAVTNEDRGARFHFTLPIS